MRKGRFRKSLARSAARFSESISFDRRLYRHDIAGSIAHASALAKAGIISGPNRKKFNLHFARSRRKSRREISVGRIARRRAHEY